jgi:hypothetical protein
MVGHMFSPSTIPSLIGYCGNSKAHILKRLGVVMPKKAPLISRAVTAGYEGDVKELYNTNPTSFAELTEVKAKIKTELEKCTTHDPKLQAMVTGIVSMKFGTYNEKHIISLFDGIIDRSVRKFTKQCESFSVSGFVDGITIIDGEKYIVEIKTRSTTNFAMSMKERIQLLCYCNIVDVDHVIFLQMQEDVLKKHIIKNFRQKYKNLWDNIVFRLSLLVIYMDNYSPDIDISEFLYWVE